MRTFRCTCGNALYFENFRCLACGRPTGYLPALREMTGFEVIDDTAWQAPSDAAPGAWRPCLNYSQHQVCNWLVQADDPNPYCPACRLTRVIPNLDLPANRQRWYRIEIAKRRLLFTLDGLNLPILDREVDPKRGLVFEFLANAEGADEFIDAQSGGQVVYTGHVGGVITLNVAEADDSARERMREIMGEEYRTLLGHFRHESGHYYWDLLIAGSAWLDEFRQLFGDERQDYQANLARHHQAGPPAAWQEEWISAYASMHPWEDWAETWAHYLHIVDTLETASDLGVVRSADPVCLQRTPDRDIPPFETLVSEWNWLSRALNALNRSMGLPDAYPFTPSPKALEKLRFVDRLIRSGPRR